MPSVASQDFGWNHIGRQSDVFTVISAGRFVPLKGFDLTIRAFADFLKCIKPENKHNCELLLIGSGPEEPMLQLLVDKLNIKSHVRFLAWMERKDLLKKFSETAAFLFPSHEGAGMVVAEALSFGVPVICLDNEGPGQFVNSSCACIVPQGNYNETVSKLASSLVELYFSPLKQTQMSQSARSLFESDFNWDRRGDDLLKLYAEL
jgi:glycosyltransferase involved in cell wall biosynthesis